MQHAAWAVTAPLAYSVLPPPVKVAVEGVPGEAALFVVNGTLAVLLPVFVLARAARSRRPSPTRRCRTSSGPASR